MNSRREPMPRSNSKMEDGEFEPLTQKQIEALYTESALFVERWLQNQFRKLGQQEVQEIVVDSFVSIMQKSEEGAIRNAYPESLRALLRRVAYNKAIDRIRLRTKIADVDHTNTEREDWLERQQLAEQETQDTPESLLLTAENQQEMAALIDTALNTNDVLNEREHDVLMRRYMEGKSYIDIARELDIPLGTALSRESSAIQKIRAHFDVPNIRRKRKPQPQQEAHGNDDMLIAAK